MRIGLIAPSGMPGPPRACGGIDRSARGLVRAGQEAPSAAAANSTRPAGQVTGTHRWGDS